MPPPSAAREASVCELIWKPSPQAGTVSRSRRRGSLRASSYASSAGPQLGGLGGLRRCLAAMDEMDMSRFAGRVAVVTGAAGGLGSAIAEDLARSGMKVAALDIKSDQLKALTERISKSTLVGSIYPLQVDVTKEADLLKTFKWVEDNLGPVAVVVNNAGIAPVANLEESSNALIADVLNVNVLATQAVTREAINSMKKHKIDDGHIINIGSTVGHPENVTKCHAEMFPMPSYVSSKHAVIGFNRALRAHLKTLGLKIRITDLSPGSTFTPIVDRKLFDQLGYTLMEPSDVSRAVRFVLSSPPHLEIVHLNIQPIGEVW